MDWGWKKTGLYDCRCIQPLFVRRSPFKSAAQGQQNSGSVAATPPSTKVRDSDDGYEQFATQRATSCVEPERSTCRFFLAVGGVLPETAQCILVARLQ